MFRDTLSALWDVAPADASANTVALASRSTKAADNFGEVASMSWVGVLPRLVVRWCSSQTRPLRHWWCMTLNNHPHGNWPLLPSALLGHSRVFTSSWWQVSLWPPQDSQRSPFDFSYPHPHGSFLQVGPRAIRPFETAVISIQDYPCLRNLLKRVD